jgi:hypothetical protein
MAEEKQVKYVVETNTVGETSKEGNGETPSPACLRFDMF